MRRLVLVASAVVDEFLLLVLQKTVGSGGRTTPDRDRQRKHEDDQARSEGCEREKQVPSGAPFGCFIDETRKKSVPVRGEVGDKPFRESGFNWLRAILPRTMGTPNKVCCAPSI